MWWPVPAILFGFLSIGLLGFSVGRYTCVSREPHRLQNTHYEEMKDIHGRLSRVEEKCRYLEEVLGVKQ